MRATPVDIHFFFLYSCCFDNFRDFSFCGGKSNKMTHLEAWVELREFVRWWCTDSGEKNREKYKDNMDRFCGPFNLTADDDDETGPVLGRCMWGFMESSALMVASVYFIFFLVKLNRYIDTRTGLWTVIQATVTATLPIWWTSHLFRIVNSRYFTYTNIYLSSSFWWLLYSLTHLYILCSVVLPRIRMFQVEQHTLTNMRVFFADVNNA